MTTTTKCLLHLALSAIVFGSAEADAQRWVTELEPVEDYDCDGCCEFYAGRDGSTIRSSELLSADVSQDSDCTQRSIDEATLLVMCASRPYAMLRHTDGLWLRVDILTDDEVTASTLETAVRSFRAVDSSSRRTALQVHGAEVQLDGLIGLANASGDCAQLTDGDAIVVLRRSGPTDVAPPAADSVFEIDSGELKFTIYHFGESLNVSLGHDCGDGCWRMWSAHTRGDDSAATNLVTRVLAGFAPTSPGCALCDTRHAYDEVWEDDSRTTKPSLWVWLVIGLAVAVVLLLWKLRSAR